MQDNKIFIVGFGAIGKALAVFFSLQGKDISVVRGHVNDGSRTEEEVVIALPDGSKLQQKIRVVTLNSLDKMKGLIILTTKSFGNKELSLSLQEKSGRSPIVILQNGLNVEAPFLENNYDHIYRCVLFSTSLVLDNGDVRFRPVTDSPVGVIKGDMATLHSIIEQINTPYFPFKAASDIQTVIWKKAIMNTAFNSICPLLEVDNGIFQRESAAFHLAQNLIQSGITIAAKVGVQLSQQEIETGLINISIASDGQSISTLQDIHKGRHTEIDTLNFELFRLAEKHGITAAAKEILLLGELIKIKEKINLAE